MVTPAAERAAVHRRKIALGSGRCGSLFAYEGTSTSVTLPIDHTQPVTVAVYAVDKAGNVSPVQTATIPAS